MKNKWFGMAAGVVVLIALLSGCGGGANEAANSGAGGAVVEEPAAEVDPMEALPPPFEVVYGEDLRADICEGCELAGNEAVGEQLRALATSVAVLVRPEALIFGNEGVRINAYSLSERMAIQYNAPMCEGERFAEQPAPGFCTGFLVGEQTLVTAGHCVPDREACKNTNFVFSFRADDNGGIESISPEQVFGCEQLLEVRREPEMGLDHALIRLDRTVDSPGLVVSAADELVEGAPLAVIGHPNGLPQKLSADGVVMENDLSQPYFMATLDTFGGNSGSPVIDLERMVVVGMLLGGEQDYDLTSESCYQVRVCEEDGSNCSGEAVGRMSSLPALYMEWYEEGIP